MTRKNAPLAVKIERDKLIIEIGVGCLAHAIQLAPSLTSYDEASGEYREPKVTDPHVFAREICNELRRESEDGTTRVHKMLDDAAMEAIEQGAEGIQLPEDDR